MSNTAAGRLESLPGTIKRTPFLWGSICNAPRLSASLSATHLAYSWGFLPEITLMVGGVWLMSDTDAHPLKANANTHALRFI